MEVIVYFVNAEDALNVLGLVVCSQAVSHRPRLASAFGDASIELRRNFSDKSSLGASGLSRI
jgi:hypothetical protein